MTSCISIMQGISQNGPGEIRELYQGILHRDFGGPPMKDDDETLCVMSDFVIFIKMKTPKCVLITTGKFEHSSEPRKLLVTVLNKRGQIN